MPLIETERRSNLTPDIVSLSNKFKSILNQIKIPVTMGEMTHHNLNINSLEFSKVHCTSLMVEAFKKQLNDKYKEVSRLFSQLNHMKLQLGHLEELSSLKITCTTDNNKNNLTSNFPSKSTIFFKKHQSSVHLKSEDLNKSKKIYGKKLKPYQKSIFTKDVFTKIEQ